MESTSNTPLSWRESALAWLQSTFAQRDARRFRKSPEENECESLIREMRRCGIRVVAWARTCRQDDYEWHGPGWFLGTNTRGEGVGFYIRDDDAAAVIAALRALRRGAHDDAIKALEGFCAERREENRNESLSVDNVVPTSRP